MYHSLDICSSVAQKWFNFGRTNLRRVAGIDFVFILRRMAKMLMKNFIEKVVKAPVHSRWGGCDTFEAR
jgi:hypothetical protein